jgi:hypothetical protein
MTARFAKPSPIIVRSCCEEKEEDNLPSPVNAYLFTKGNAMRYSSRVFEKFADYLVSVGFRYLNQGSFRQVYERGSVVIKIPVNRNGMIDNRAEARAYQKYKNNPTSKGVYLMPCRLLPNGCLMMRKFEEGPYQRPDWSHLVDGHQLGRYKGRIVAYDYALDLVDRFQWEKEWGIKTSFFSSKRWRLRRAHIHEFLLQKEKEPIRKAG